ncbi:MAG: hypothetical protein HY827_02500 [Actinobacteria bacterium]|nr:hypothetical protein [Actinomycetota bacterium]
MHSLNLARSRPYWSRHRARPTRALLIALIASLCATLGLVSTSAATTFSLSSTGAQAGADQDQTWAFTAASGEVVTGLQLRMTGGYWPHMHQVAKRCAAADAASATGCPAGSRLAAVNAVFSARGIVSVPVTGYLADSADRSSEVAGADALLVLNPPSSAFKRIVKPVTIDVAGQAGQPVLRVSLRDMPALELTSGAALSAPLTALAFNGNDTTSGRKRWLRNPTACGTAATISAVATLADGRVQTTTRAPNISGCTGLSIRVTALFNPKEYTPEKVRGFKLAMDLHDHVAGEAISDARSVELRVGTGHLDLDALAKLPTCDDATLAKDACPSDSRLGELQMTSGSDRYASGEVWNQSVSRGSAGDGSVKLAYTLRSGGGAGGAGGIISLGHGSARDFVNNGGVAIVLDGMPQIDGSKLRMTGANPLYEDKSCSASSLTGSVTGWSGVRRDIRSTVRWRCAPKLALTDPRDADADGDGYADQRFRPAFFDVFFSVADGGDGVDWSSLACKVRGWDPTQKQPIVALADIDRDGRPDVCHVEGASDGDYTVQLSATDATKTATAEVSRRFTIDTTPPQISAGSSTRTTPSTSFGTLVRVSDDHGVAIVRCGVATGAGAAAGAATCVNGACSASTAGSAGDPDDYLCQVESTDEGMVRFELEATDLAGNKATSFFDVFFDRTAPVVTPTDVADTDGDGVPDRRFSTGRFDQYFVDTDDSFEDPGLRRQARRACRATRKATPWKHHDIQAVDADGDHAGQSICRFDGLEDGDWEIAISVTDAAGNVGTATADVTVDTMPPVVKSDTPADGDWIACRFKSDPYAEDAVRVAFTLMDSTADLARVEVSFNSGPRQSVSLDNGKTTQTVDLNIDCREMTTGMDVEYRIFATDLAGNTSETPTNVRVDATPPVVTPTTWRDADKDSDGRADMRWRPPSFDVPFDASDVGSGLASKPSSCAGRLADGSVIDGIVDGADGSFVCHMSGLPEGDLTLEISAFDVAGLVTVLKRGYTVDNTPPQIEFAQASPVHTTTSSHDVVFSVTDTAATVDGAPLFLTDCEVKKADSEPNAPCDCIVAYRPASGGLDGGLDGNCPLTNLAVGLNRMMLTVTDPAGNSTTAFFDVFRDPPLTVEFVGAPDAVNTARPTFNLDIKNGDPQGATDCFAIPEVDDEVLIIFTCRGTWNGGGCDCAATSTQDLPEGKYFIHAIHRGADGRAVEATHEFTVDLTPPSVTFTSFEGAPIDPASPPQTTNPEPEAEFTVSEPAQTECAVDTDPTGETPASELEFAACTLKIKAGPNAAGAAGSTKSWCFRVRATDDAGNVSDSKLCFTITPSVVNAAPQVTIASPRPGEVLPTQQVPVVFDVVDNDLVSVRCTLNPNASGTVVKNDCHSGDVLGPAGNRTNARVLVEATDSAGQVGSQTVTFITDTLAPQVQINGVVGLGGYNSPWPSFQIDTFTYDDSGPVSTSCAWDSTPLSACPDPLQLSAIANGTHTLSLSATDLAGHTTTVTKSIVVDATRPAVNVTGPSGYNMFNQMTFTFNYGSVAPISTVRCYLDGSPMAVCNSGMTQAVSGGDHTFTVTVTNVNGLSASSSSSFWAYVCVPQPGQVCLH